MSFNTEVQPGICMEPDAITQEYVFNHTMLRVKDPKRSLDFYSRVLGMRLLRRLDFEEGRFSLYFLAMTRGEEVPDAVDERQRYTFGRQSVLELTHNWGSERRQPVPQRQPGPARVRPYLFLGARPGGGLRAFRNARGELRQAVGPRHEERGLHQRSRRLLGGNRPGQPERRDGARLTTVDRLRAAEMNRAAAADLQPAVARSQA